MHCLPQKILKSFFYRFVSIIVLFAFTSNLVFPLQISLAQTILNLPSPGEIITPSIVFTPPLIKGIIVHPENPLEFDFIVEAGDDKLRGTALRQEAMKLIRYFMASVTLPEEDVWVNLSPYEKDRIVSNEVGITELGKDLLSQDYILKQLTASLMYPETDLGKKFWQKVYAKAKQLYGTTNIPINTFNKVWIVPDKAVVYENGNKAFVMKSRLKVMLESDYLAFQENLYNKKLGTDQLQSSEIKKIHDVSSDIVKELVLPEIEKEVNEGKNFANLRQIYNAQVLAYWYKTALKTSLLVKVYANKKKIKGVDIKDKEIKQKIYQQYLDAFKVGVYNYIKEDIDPVTEQSIPRKYFSGGYVTALEGHEEVRHQVTPEDITTASQRADVPAIQIGVKVNEIGPGSQATQTQLTEIQQPTNDYTDPAQLSDTIVRLLENTDDVISEMTAAHALGNKEAYDQALEKRHVTSLNGVEKPYLFAVGGRNPQGRIPLEIDVSKLSFETIQARMRDIGKLEISTLEAAKIKNRTSFLVKRRPYPENGQVSDERLGQIYQAALKSGLLGVQYLVTNIQPTTDDSILAYIHFLQTQILPKYNGYVFVLLSVQRSLNDGGGMAMTMNAVKAALGADFENFRDHAQINLLTDGGLKTRGGEWTGLFEKMGPMPTQYGITYYERQIITLGKVRLQHQNFGDGRVYWTASDGDYTPGELSYGTRFERNLDNEDPSWSMVIHGQGEAAFPQEQKTYFFGELDRALSVSGGDYTEAEKNLRQKGDPRMVGFFHKVERLTQLGENFSHPQTGRLVDFKEKPNPIEILEMLKKSNTHFIIPNAFLIFYKSTAFWDHVEIAARTTSEKKRLDEYGWGYFDMVIGAQFDDKKIPNSKYPQEVKDGLTQMHEIFSVGRGQIIAASVDDFTDRGKTTEEAEAYDDRNAEVRARGERGIVKKGRVIIGPGVTLKTDDRNVVTLENVTILNGSGKPNVTIEFGDGVYIQNSIIKLTEEYIYIEAGTKIILSRIERPFKLNGKDTVILGVVFREGETLYDMTLSGVWQPVRTLELVGGETVVSILYKNGTRYLKRGITEMPYKSDPNIDASFKGYYKGRLPSVVEQHIRLFGNIIGNPDNFEKDQLTASTWMGAGPDESVSLDEARKSMALLKTYQEHTDLLTTVGAVDNASLTERHPDAEGSPIALGENLAQGRATKVATSNVNVKDVGGINLNLPKLLDFQIKRDGNGSPLPINQQPIGDMKIEGFIPIFLYEKPVSLPLLLSSLEQQPNNVSVPTKQNQDAKRPNPPNMSYISPSLRPLDSRKRFEVSSVKYNYLLN